MEADRTVICIYGINCRKCEQFVCRGMVHLEGKVSRNSQVPRGVNTQETQVVGSREKKKAGYRCGYESEIRDAKGVMVTQSSSEITKPKEDKKEKRFEIS